MGKDLRNRAIQIKGKDYVQVKDRIVYLADEIKDYSIISDYEFYPEQRLWVVKSTLTIGDNTYVGLAQEVESDDYRQVNATSALENCQTSAIGRACAMAGIGVLDSIASVDEMNKATNRVQYNKTPRRASIKQIELLVNKVKWGLKEYDKDETIRFLDGVLGKPLTDLMASEMDEAILKVDQAIRETKVADAIDPIKETPDYEAGEGLDDIENLTQADIAAALDKA